MKLFEAIELYTNNDLIQVFKNYQSAGGKKYITIEDFKKAVDEIKGQNKNQKITGSYMSGLEKNNASTNIKLDQKNDPDMSSKNTWGKYL